ncbi:MAG: hypothetical protein ABID63_16280 [Pseudomonadota bacterium]
MDISSLNPFRQGVPALTDERQPLTVGNGKTGASAQSPKQSVDPVALSDDAQASQQAGKNNNIAAPASETVSAEDLFSRALDAALDLIKDKMIEMFTLAGMDEKQAEAATNKMFDQIRNMAAGTGDFDFSFKQSVASYSRTEIAYAGSGSMAAGVSESAMMAAQSLDISINRNTGEFSFNYEATQISVTKTTAVAIGNNMDNAMGALGAVMDGLGSGNLVDMLGNPASSANGGLLFDINGNGIADFIRELMGDTSGSDDTDPATDAETSATSLAAERMADLNKQIMESAALIVRSIEETLPDNGEDPILKMTVDMLMPLGRFGAGPEGSVFTLPDGNQVAVTAPQTEQDVLV